eukprot:Transcript_10636.p1 GENE.Transcript_10636~~Transcript_10636.p1  ORF type:complete len:405 (-),score=5.26 Transcript_10636:214-1368(-)
MSGDSNVWRVLLILVLQASVDSRHKWCGPTDLKHRSYELPVRWPYPSIRLVMETQPKGCDLYWDRSFCRRLEAGLDFEPECHVVEVISSFLVGCHQRVCRAVDLGANNGWMTAYMLALGASVVSAEAQADLVNAVNETIELNCWRDRGKVLFAFVEADPAANGMRTMHKGYRAGLKPKRIVLPPVPAWPIDKILLGAASERHDSRRGGLPTLQLLKMDADGPEGSWLERIDALLAQGLMRIETMVVECSGCKPQTLHRLQKVHGYQIFQLDMHIDQRFLDARGIDVYSGFRPALSAQPDFVDERYSVRLMRHLYHFRQNMTLQEWVSIPKGLVRMKHPQYLLTLLELVEPHREHPLARKPPSLERKTSGWRPGVTETALRAARG